MQKFITALLAAALWLGGPLALAQSDIKLQDDAPDRYVVEKGDTLWGIAGKFLKDTWRWPGVWRMNQDQIKNPHWIYPGNVIILDRSVTPPQLRLSGSDSSRSDTVKLVPQVRGESLTAEAIPPIPLKAIEPFLSQPLLIEEGGLDKAPRIIAIEENHVNLGPGGIAYVSGMSNAADSSLWQVYRPGRPLVDPDSNRTLGIEAVFLGTARMTRGGEPATVQIVSSKQEIAAGDRLISALTPEISPYMPHAPRTSFRGRIIGLYNNFATSVGGRDSIISINRGARDGLEVGHVLAVYRNVVVVDQQNPLMSRDSAPTIKLPDERYGLIFIFRTFNAVSYALVMESSRPIQPGDIVQTP
ncbi:MAG: LysM peptidoglycan-binding domain-containing protein [Burkholderiales bacterium]